MSQPRSISCVETGAPSRRRLDGAEAIVIIVITVVAAALAAVAEMSVPVILQLIAGAGLTAGLVLCLVTGEPIRGLRSLVRALLAPAA
ncbi:hypothetical protein [Streptomyces sp. NRRL S-337]|uniref:hypothetical protein n=1 Tax=Streptomyces sp. NRRL S-337 TaxID=1463900 RepID=UPI0004C66B03|nr:hypothetical protein [Streptomyces sp. NRRL S-337]